MEGLASSFVAESYESAVERFFEEGWTDGLPVVLPTRRLVDAMVAASGAHPEVSLGEMPPKGGRITIAMLAVNAVMGGCTPAMFPIVVAAIEAMLAPEHNLNGVIQTTHMCSTLAIVNGPTARRLNFNARDGVFGNGFRANAAVGRALRLAMWNLGGAIPGKTDMSTFSNPSEYAFCISEEEEDNPWEPLHVERGCTAGSDAVTVFACEAPHSALCQGTLGEILYVLTDTMSAIGNNNVHTGGQTLVVLNPNQAAEFARAGWSKNDVREHLWVNCGRTIGEMAMTGKESSELRRILVTQGRQPVRYTVDAPSARIPLTTSPQDIHIVVAGGRTHFAAVCPGWGSLGGLAVTRQVAAAARN
jgi:hypothetical protein